MFFNSFFVLPSFPNYQLSFPPFVFVLYEFEVFLIHQIGLVSLSTFIFILFHFAIHAIFSDLCHFQSVVFLRRCTDDAAKDYLND